MSMRRGAASSPTLTRADIDTHLRQFPFTGYPSWLLQMLPVILSNAYVLWLLLQGRLSGAGLILIVAIEAVVLMLLVNLAALPVPRAHWQDPPKPWREVLPAMLFLAIWCGGAYGMTLAFIKGWPDMQRYLQEPAFWIESGVATALGLTFGLALMTAVGDWLRYRRLGPPYVPALSHDVMARILTLIFGAIPFAMPFFVGTIGGIKGMEWIGKRARTDLLGAGLVALAMLVFAGACYLLVQALVKTELHAWAIGFVLAKLLSELTIASLSLIMHLAGKEIR